MTRHIILMACTLVVCLWGLTSLASAAVVAIDFGTEGYKTIVLQGANAETVLNTESERKTFSMVGFNADDERFFGTQARNLLGKRPKLVFVSPHTLIGKKFNNNTLDLSQYLYPLSEDKVTGGFSITKNGKTFSPEEVTAMILQNAIRSAETYTGRSGLRDIVLVLPPFLSQQEKKGFINSAKIAGLNVAAIVNHGLSAALTYSLNRDVEAELKAANNSEARQLFIFYDMGASYTTATLVEYKLQKDGKKANSQSLSILSLGTTWDSNLGGKNFDRCVESYMIERARDKMKNKNFLDDDRVVARLRREAQKVKEILSANTETMIYIESLTPEEDYKDKITRTEFETRCHTEFLKSAQPIADLLKNSNVTVSDITGIELIGGGGRIPKVQDLIKEVLGIDSIGKHLNGDEAAVYGAAFYGALKSSGVQMRNKIRIRDISTYDIIADLNIDEEINNNNAASSENSEEEVVEETEDPTENEQAKEKRGILFKAGSRLETKRTLTFRQASNFSVDLYYTYNASSPLSHPLPVGVEELFSRFEITGLPTASSHNFTGVPKVILTLQLNPSGIVEVAKAEAEILATTLVKTKILKASGSSTPTPAPTIPAEPKDDADKEPQEEKEEKEEKEKSSDPLYEMVPTTKLTKVTLKVNNAVLPSELSAFAISMAKGKLKNIDDADEERKKREKSRNDLEAFVYATREKLNDDEFAKYATSDDQDLIRSLLLDEEDWLYDGGINASVKELDEHLASLQKVVAPIALRYNEAPIRQERADEFKTMLNDLKLSFIKISLERQVPQKELDELVDSIQKNLEWIDSVLEEQASKSLTEEPAFTMADIQTRAGTFLKSIKDLKKRPKRVLATPSVTPTPAAEAEQETTEKQQEGETEQNHEETEKKNNNNKNQEPIFEIPIGNDEEVPLDQDPEVVL